MGYDEKKRKFQNPSQEIKESPQYVKTPVTEAFETYAKEMELKQDKYERIVKISRDITIASKRIIYSLHALMRSGDYEEDLDKITDTLKTVRNTLLKSIAFELSLNDPYQYTRAYAAGLQEYIEAITFYHFITKGRLFNLEELKEELTFQEDTENEGDVEKVKVPLLVPLLDYILGVQDLTGELMRHCISSFTAHNKEAGYNDCNFVKHLYTGMLVLNLKRGGLGRGRDFSRKLDVALQSLKKMEMACYAKHIQGSEAFDCGLNPDASSAEFETYTFGD